MRTRRNALRAISGLTGAGVARVAFGHSTDKQAGRTDASEEGTNRRNEFLGTWTASPQAPLAKGVSARGFEDETLRLLTRTSVGGHAIRIRLSNAFGDRPVTFDRASVGIQAADASVEPGTLRRITFGGEPSVTIPSGSRVVSDPVDRRIGPGQNLAISLYVESATGPATWHQLETRTSYVSPAGDRTTELNGDAFTTPVTHWFFLEGVDVLAPNKTGAIVCFGDSITDGAASTIDANASYPAVLSDRVNEQPFPRKSVLNAGISGNRVRHDSDTFGENALARFDRDVLTQPGVTDIVLLEGINDIGFERNSGSAYTPAASVTADEIIAGYKQLIQRAHTHGVRIVGGTLTPFEGAEYYYEEGERKRQQVNEFVRTSGAFDGVIDFDRAIRDPDDPERIRPEYDSGDHLHPSDAGYRAMAEAIDLNHFRRPG